MGRNIAAIIAIFFCTTLAWMILGLSIEARTQGMGSDLGPRVESLWGAPQEQAAPVAPRAPVSSIERAALAAIAAAVAPDAMQPIAPVSMQPASYGDVTVRPIAQKPSLFPELDARKLEAHEPATPETFIPQAPERAAVAWPRSRSHPAWAMRTCALAGSSLRARSNHSSAFLSSPFCV